MIPLLFSMLFVQCSKGSGTIAPILPSGDYAYQSERVLPPDDYDYGDRSGYQNRTNVLLQVTAPAEYIISQLNPPLVTDNQPTFSAIVHNNISRLSEDDFIATVDGEHVRCMFNAALNEVSFTPASPLKNGNHHAMLIFKNPDGSARSLYLSFRIDTEPPNIDLVMWCEEYDYALVIFDRAIEPVRLSESSRWRFNAEQNILRENVIIAGNSTVLLPLTNDAFDMNRNREPLTVSFIDKNGTADYVVRRGGSMIRKVQGDPPCDCSEIDIIIAQEHHFLEAGAEDYAFCYTVNNPNNCDLTMEWEGWSLTPVANVDPTIGSNYDLSIDTLCAGTGQAGFPGVPYPLDFSMPLNLGENEMATVIFEREYSHSLNVSFWADCTTEQRPDDDPHETWIADQHFAFYESFDCKHPVFDEEPIVLYGDEAAYFIHYGLMEGLPHNPYDWPTRIPLAGEDVNGDLYCFSLNRAYYSFLMEQLVLHNCDLFIITKASDPITALRQGNMAPQQMVLDYKYTGGTYDYGNSYVGGDPGTGNIVIDKKPWACRYPGFMQGELELFHWPDDDWPLYLEEGGYKHDWCGEEIAIKWWNLTDILLDDGGVNIEGIKVRITDNTQQKPSGYHGNWRRSADVMEQLCAMSPRGGSVHRKGEGPFDPAVEIQVEPGIPPENPNDPQLYWIDGPAIPIFGSKEHPTDDETPIPSYCWDNWDMYTLQHKWLPFDYDIGNDHGVCPMGSFIPNLDDMRIGEIKIRICINFDCIYAFRIYAIGPEDKIYDIKPDPNEDNIYFTNINDYRLSCWSPLPLRCLDDGYITWDISALPCGEYKIHVEAYSETVFKLLQIHACIPSLIETAESDTLELDKVKKSDLVRIAPIYDGDGYHETSSILRNGYRPRNNHETEENNCDEDETVDCTNYVTQLLRRLGRLDHDTHIDTPTGDYPIDHSRASWWNTDREDEVNHLEDHQWYLMEKGDLVTRDPRSWTIPDIPHHVMVFVRIDDDGIPDDLVGPFPDDYYESIGYEYSYEEWESTSDNDDGVRLHTRTGDSRTHFRQWLDDVVFTNCE